MFDLHLPNAATLKNISFCVSSHSANTLAGSFVGWLSHHKNVWVSNSSLILYLTRNHLIMAHRNQQPSPHNQRVSQPDVLLAQQTVQGAHCIY